MIDSEGEVAMLEKDKNLSFSIYIYFHFRYPGENKFDINAIITWILVRSEMCSLPMHR